MGMRRFEAIYICMSFLRAGGGTEQKMRRSDYLKEVGDFNEEIYWQSRQWRSFISLRGAI